MASVLQEPEIQFAQRLASNERSVRTRALKKLKKYLNVRSQIPKGGFTIDEFLKLWKGLFYCLWMQDKPLLQEELATQISGLIHSLQSIDNQFLFLESFLRTISREWNGIDRLRMDKFYTLVRFVFRQAFELLKRKEWEAGLVGRFTELLSAQVLHTTCEAPRGVQYHVLDIYMPELTRAGAAELTAEQNMKFIEPFCKAAVKTKDHDLLQAVYSGIFHEIVEQAPFAIEDLMREVRMAGGSGSTQDQDLETESKVVPNRPRNGKEKRVNGVTVAEEDEEEELEEEEEDIDLSYLEQDAPQDEEGIGPVLQFDYKALSDRLFELAGRSNTRTFNRKKLSGVVKTFRDLSEGVFPRDENPEEVSTDEDDDMFGSRRRLRRKRRNRDDEPDEEQGLPVKKRKGKENSKKPTDPVTGAAHSAAETQSEAAKKKKRKKRRKNKKKGEKTGTVEEEKVEGKISPAEEKVEEKISPAQDKVERKNKVERKSSPAQEKVEEKVEMEISPAQEKVEEKISPAEEKVERESSPAQEKVERKNKVERKSSPAQEKVERKNKVERKSSPAQEKVEEKVEGKISPAEEKVERESSPAQDKVERESSPAQEKVEKQGEQERSAAQLDTGAEQTPPDSGKRAGSSPVGEGVQSPSCAETLDRSPVGTDTPAPVQAQSQSDGATSGEKVKRRKRRKRRSSTREEGAQEADTEGVELSAVEAGGGEGGGGGEEQESQSVLVEEEPGSGEADAIPASPGPNRKRVRNRKRKSRETPEPKQEEAVEPTQPDAGSVSTDEQPGDVSPATQLRKRKKKKTTKTMVAQEGEGEAAQINGHAEEEAGGKKARQSSETEAVCTPAGPKKPLKKKKAKATPKPASEFVTFQSPSVPVPLFCRQAKGSPSTPKSRKQSSLTPLSESKKVTFGLKNNKTAEFKKTDRSLMVSPDGSSRVPFDPRQKPRFGVLKSPASPPAAKGKSKKNSAPKGRPKAADFF